MNVMCLNDWMWRQSLSIYREANESREIDNVLFRKWKGKIDRKQLQPLLQRHAF